MTEDRESHLELLQVGSSKGHQAYSQREIGWSCSTMLRAAVTGAKPPEAEFMVSATAIVLTARVAFHQCVQNTFKAFPLLGNSLAAH